VNKVIYIPPQAKIFTIPDPVLLNNSIDIYIGICKRQGLEPFSGELFVFRDEDATQIGILSYDGHGFHWCIKRFSEGNIAWWPSEEEVVQILARDLQVMLWGGNPRNIDLPSMWRPLMKEKQ
jgi:transposase